MSRQKRGHESAKTCNSSKSVDCEVGVISVSLEKSATGSLKPKQRLQSGSFRELWMGLVEALSYRDTANLINRLLRRDEDSKLKVSTLKDRVESQGKALADSYAEKERNILTQYNLDSQEAIVTNSTKHLDSICSFHQSTVLGEASARKHIADYNHGRETNLKLEYSDPLSQTETSTQGCCYISIDDIGVRSQKEERKPGYAKKRKFLENTVIHIQANNRQYTITAVGMKKAFNRLVAFLLDNHLLEGYRLVFFTDGATVIRDYIEKYFGFRQHAIILDWLHLKKKCVEFLSMGVKGTKEDKSQIKNELAAILWTGRVEKAIKYIDSIKQTNIKNTKKLSELKDYLKRKSPNVVCYALRHELNLRISSNRVEKANDMVVAVRQKHNGMSWSKNGSGALAIITAARINGELDSWIKTGEINFKMVG